MPKAAWRLVFGAKSSDSDVDSVYGTKLEKTQKTYRPSESKLWAVKNCVVPVQNSSCVDRAHVTRQAAVDSWGKVADIVFACKVGCQCGLLDSEIYCKEPKK